MDREKNYAILGMGRFGRTVAETVAKTGVEILIADKDDEVISRYGDDYTYAVTVDLSNPDAIKEIGLENIDVVIIDLAGDVESAVTSTMIVKEIGVKKIYATAASKYMGDMLKKLGADEVVIPEEDTAFRLARNLISDGFMDYYVIGDDMCLIRVLPKKEWVYKTIRNLELRNKRGINIIAIEIDGVMTSDFTPDHVIEKDKLMALALNKKDIYEFI